MYMLSITICSKLKMKSIIIIFNILSFNMFIKNNHNFNMSQRCSIV